MLRYLDKRYKNIAGHQGLTRFVDDFPRFHRAIEEYVQRNHLRELVDGTMTIIPGINFMPWDVFAFIDDSIDRISTPFSGLCRDYEGAACRAEYANAQQAFYTGYIKAHGIKVETVFLPNGLCTLFGPVSVGRPCTCQTGIKGGNDVTVTSRRKRAGGGVGDRRNDGGSSRRLCPSNGLAYHPCGLKHGMVDAIDCFNVVAVLRVTH